MQKMVVDYLNEGVDMVNFGFISLNHAKNYLDKLGTAKFYRFTETDNDLLKKNPGCGNIQSIQDERFCG